MRYLSVFALVCALAGPLACIKKQKTPENVNNEALSDVTIPEEAADTFELDNHILETAVSAEALSKALPEPSSKKTSITLNLMVKEDWNNTVPMKMRSGDVKKLSETSGESDVVALGDIPVLSLKSSKNHLTTLRKLKDKIKKPFPLYDIIQAEVRADSVPELISVINRLNRLPGVLFTEPNGAVKAIATPNDPRMPELWGMFSIQAPTLWDSHKGIGLKTVAVLDTGIELTHPDLKDNLWTNTNEIPGNGVDDDNNGFIDDVNGWNFAFDDNNTNDLHGHGTHCAGIIGAKGNNALGVTGVAWNTKIMPVKVLDDFGNGDYRSIYRGILYAIANGATILSNSYGSSFTSVLMARAVLMSNTAETLFIAAAGNESAAKAIYPAYYTTSFDNVISVASTRQNGELSLFSNYADGVDIAAPGESILSTYTFNKYVVWSGTSMAAPMVAGTAAVLWDAFPNKSNDEIKKALLDGSNYKQAFEGKITGARDLNADNSLKYLLGTATQRPGTPPTIVKGVRFEYYEGKWNMIPNFAGLPPSNSGTTEVVSLSVANRNNNFGISFEGFLKVETAGAYKFMLSSDDGSKLWIDDTLVVKNDGIHSRKEKTGKIKLEKGYRKFKLEYFQAGQGKNLSLHWSGPGFKKRSINSPGQLFYFR